MSCHKLEKIEEKIVDKSLIRTGIPVSGIDTFLSTLRDMGKISIDGSVLTKLDKLYTGQGIQKATMK